MAQLGYRRWDGREWVLGPVLGSGSFSCVYVAYRSSGSSWQGRHGSSGTAAVKVLAKSSERPDVLRNEAECLRFLSRCSSENLLKLYGAYEDSVFEDDTSVYLVCEVCQGWLLGRLLEARGFLEPSLAASIIRQLASALSDLHKHGIWHRDVKPDNALFVGDSPASTLKLIDYGMAKMPGVEDKELEIMGSEHYVAPEVLQAQRYSSLADMWALGATAYVLLCGAHPYTDEELEQARVAPPSFAEPAWACVPREAQELVRRLLSQSPYSRPSAEQVLRDPWVQSAQAPLLQTHFPFSQGAQAPLIRRQRSSSFSAAADLLFSRPQPPMCLWQSGEHSGMDSYASAAGAAAAGAAAAGAAAAAASEPVPGACWDQGAAATPYAAAAWDGSADGRQQQEAEARPAHRGLDCEDWEAEDEGSPLAEPQARTWCFGVDWTGTALAESLARQMLWEPGEAARQPALHAQAAGPGAAAAAAGEGAAAAAVVGLAALHEQRSVVSSEACSSRWSGGGAGVEPLDGHTAPWAGRSGASTGGCTPVPLTGSVDLAAAATHHTPAPAPCWRGKLGWNSSSSTSSGEEGEQVEAAGRSPQQQLQQQHGSTWPAGATRGAAPLDRTGAAGVSPAGRGAARALFAGR